MVLYSMQKRHVSPFYDARLLLGTGGNQLKEKNKTKGDPVITRKPPEKEFGSMIAYFVSSALDPRLSSVASSASSFGARPTGDHAAATPAATRPAMTVGAPSAEFDRDRIDLDRLRDSGVAAPDPNLSSIVGVCGGGSNELERE